MELKVVNGTDKEPADTMQTEDVAEERNLQAGDACYDEAWTSMT